MFDAEHPYVYDVGAQDGFCDCGRGRADPMHTWDPRLGDPVIRARIAAAFAQWFAQEAQPPASSVPLPWTV